MFYQTNTWNDQPIPTEYASRWNCKYRIYVDRDMITDSEDQGFIFIEIEPYAFDHYVYLIVQPFEEFNDYVGLDGITKIYEVAFG